MRKKLKRFTASEKVLVTVVLLFLSVYSFSLLYPLIWTTYSAAKNVVDYTLHPYQLPNPWYLKNFVEVFSVLKVNVVTSTVVRDVYIFEMLLNTFIYAGLGAFLTVFVPSLTSYVISKYRFKGRNLLYSFAIIMMVLPIIGALPSALRVMTALGFKDNLFGVLIMLGGGFGFNFLVLYSSFKSVDWGYAEAAFIDGAGHGKVFFQIMLPLVKPVLVSLGILSFINLWNDYMTPMLYLATFPTISLGVFRFQFEASAQGYSMPHILAGFVIAMVPILAVFICFQKIIMTNTATGGLKG